MKKGNTNRRSPIDFHVVNAGLKRLAGDVATLHDRTVRQYIVRWDKINAQCVRMGSAFGIATDTTNFAHRGSLNSSYNNPFDAVYPWSGRKLCKVNRATYKALRDAGGDIMGAITAWEDQPGFVLDGTGDFDGVYTPGFWWRQWQDASYWYVGVADGAIPGWIYSPPTVGGRYFGSKDGDGKMTSIAGAVPWRFDGMSAMQANAVAQGLTLDDVWTWCADTVLMVVEYATLNSQLAVGNGCHDLYSQGSAGSEHRPLLAESGANRVIAPVAMQSNAIAGAILDIGTSNGAGNVASRVIAGAAAYPENGAYCIITFGGAPVNTLTTHYLSIHGCHNAPDAVIGSKSGYIGTNGKCNAYYRGRIAHANYWRYILGAYRQTGTGAIWVAHNRQEAMAHNALNTGVHIDTGLVLPTGSGGTELSGYLGSLLYYSSLPLAPFGGSVGGNSSNPIGDYLYVPALASGNTVLLAGGYASNGACCGRFFGLWYNASSSGYWNYAALHLFQHGQPCGRGQALALAKN